MSKGRTLRPEERRLWSRIARTARPRPGKSVPEEPPKPGPIESRAEKTMARPKKSASHSVKQKHEPKPSAPPPADMSAERRVRRGRTAFESRLDLHGLTVDQARAALAPFIERERAKGARCVLVITGKGEPALRRYSHEQPGILRRMLPMWLSAPDIRPHISGYAPAHQRHGGAGAWYVFLKHRPQGETPFR